MQREESLQNTELSARRKEVVHWYFVIIIKL